MADNEQQVREAYLRALAAEPGELEVDDRLTVWERLRYWHYRTWQRLLHTIGLHSYIRLGDHRSDRECYWCGHYVAGPCPPQCVGHDTSASAALKCSAPGCASPDCGCGRTT